jgi:hypothetical protein
MNRGKITIAAIVALPVATACGAAQWGTAECGAAASAASGRGNVSMRTRPLPNAAEAAAPHRTARRVRSRNSERGTRNLFRRLQDVKPPPLATSATEDYGPFISKTFERYKMDLPQLGWIVPPRTIVARDHYSELFVYSDAPKVQRARWIRALTPGQILELRQKAGVACMPAPQHNEYRLPASGSDSVSPQPAQIFFTTRRLVQKSVEVNIGQATQDEMNDAFELFAVNRRGTLTKAFHITAGGFTFTFVGFFQSENGNLFAEGLILYGPDGDVAGSQSWDVSDNGGDAPGYEDDLEDEFPVVNVFRLPHFSAPLLLEDTSAGESDALSLITFDAEGRYAEYRIAEDVKGCGQMPRATVVARSGKAGSEFRVPGSRRANAFHSEPGTRTLQCGAAASAASGRGPGKPLQLVKLGAEPAVSGR